MILECPACHARYAVPDHAIGASGRSVRCAKCKHNWFQAAPESLAGKPLAELDAMLKEAAKPVEKKPLRRGANVPAIKGDFVPIGIKIATASFALTAIVIMLFAFKPAWVGFTPSKGLILADVVMSKREIKEMTLYEITGKFHNTTDQPMEIPSLRVTLLDKSGGVVRLWETAGDGVVVEPNKTVDFNSGDLAVTSLGERFVLELGNTKELMMRKKI
ncbi:MAG: zinc-ribbon domain-containing protein [Rickettsiales bacterium]|jgi:predicted Zn finger-like uncharacterized protein|nr:zinc-ribbon domain-containing protein [Rickettsiales bacterium]